MYGEKFAFQKLTELACSGKEIYHFCFVLLCIRGQIPSTSPPGGLYLEGRFNGGFFALPVWGAYFWRGLYTEGLIFGILRYMYLKDCVTTFIQIQTQGMDTKLSETFKQPLKKLVTQQNTKVGTDGQT